MARCAVGRRALPRGEQPGVDRRHGHEEGEPVAGGDARPDARRRRSRSAARTSRPPTARQQSRLRMPCRWCSGSTCRTWSSADHSHAATTESICAASTGVRGDDALRLAGGAAGVEDQRPARSAADVAAARAAVPASSARCVQRRRPRSAASGAEARAMRRVGDHDRRLRVVDDVGQLRRADARCRAARRCRRRARCPIAPRRGRSSGRRERRRAPRPDRRCRRAARRRRAPRAVEQIARRSRCRRRRSARGGRRARRRGRRRDRRPSRGIDAALTLPPGAATPSGTSSSACRRGSTVRANRRMLRSASSYGMPA